MGTDTGWAPDACTLPTARQPLRMAEFAALFSSALRGVERRDPAVLRLTVDASARGEAVRLTEAESSCCSFFDFTVGDPAGDTVHIDVRVPPNQVSVLDGLQDQARSALPS